MLAGFLFIDFIDVHLRGLTTIAWATLGFGILLGVAYRFRGSDGDEQSITRVDHALIIGLAQALAVIPGTSRMFTAQKFQTGIIKRLHPH